MSNSTPSFQPSCPSGGDWYACGNGAKFVGCCTSDPCNDNGCFQGNLRPASFLASAYGTFPDQQCSGGSWYTCQATDPTFLGCCSVNPCLNNGCPDGNLKAGYLSNNPAEANVFDPYPPLSSSSVSATSTSSVSSTSSSVMSPPSSTSQSNVNPSALDNVRTPNIVSKGTIAGAVVGGAVVLLLILAALVFISRRYCRRRLDAHSSQALNDTETVWGGGGRFTVTSHHSDMKQTPTYSMRTVSQQYRSDPASPMLEVFEADSRAVSDYTSPVQSPAFRSDQRVSTRPVSSFAVTSIYSDKRDQIAELDGRERR